MKPYPPGLPCWAPGAADHLASLLTGEEVAFEWGGGASTVWLAPQVFQLTVMESSPKWAKHIQDNTERRNCLVAQKAFTDDDYVNYAIGGVRRPDLWLIDGYRRIDCLELVGDNAENGDIVVLDDALDYAEHLLRGDSTEDITRFSMPHPYAGTPIDLRRHKDQRNTVRTHHAATKETWVWQV